MSSNSLIHYIDSMFDDALGLRPLMNTSRAISTAPALNINEYDNYFQISLTIPGLDPADVKVELVDQVLNISYTHDDTHEEKKKGKLIRQEYEHFGFSRSIRLPKNINESSIKAKSNKGILNITIDKLPENQPKKIEIELE
jgi:HSP20 family protein